MRIVSIQERTVPLHTPIRNSLVDFSQMTGSIVAVVTDIVRDGKPVVGYGFNSNGRYSAGAIIRNRLVPRIMNADPASLVDTEHDNLDAFALYRLMMQNEKPGGHGERSVAVGTIDMAVWDAIAKIEGKPLWQLLADRYRDGQADPDVWVYAAGGYYLPGKGLDGLKDELKGYLDLGYEVVKIKVGGAPLAEDLKRIEAAIEVVGSGANLCVDANGRFDLETAIAYGDAIAPYGLRWYEEPGDPLDYALHATLSERYAGPLATGENLFSYQDARNLLRYGGMRSDRDWLQFDCALSYGMPEYLRILDMMALRGWSSRRIAPHGGHQMSLNLAAGLHLGGNESYPGIFQPFGGFADGIRVENGRVRLPDVPGIGIEMKSNLYALMRESFG